MKKKCILIYDDDPDMSLICKLILEQENYRVESRKSCNNIIEEISDMSPDLLLIDLRIPEIGGEKAIQMIRDNVNTRHIPIVIFSANSEIEEIYKRLDTNGFLKKPFEITHLQQTVAANIQ